MTHFDITSPSYSPVSGFFFFFFLIYKCPWTKVPFSLARVNGNVTEVNIKKQDSDKDII